jgi:superkiller protein 3
LALGVQAVFLWDRAEAEQEGDVEEARRLRRVAAEHFLAAA